MKSSLIHGSLFTVFAIALLSAWTLKSTRLDEQKSGPLCPPFHLKTVYLALFPSATHPASTAAASCARAFPSSNPAPNRLA